MDKSMSLSRQYETSRAPPRARGELPLAGRAASHAEDGLIDFDAPCRRCGYNLRGLQLNQDCPECSAPAWTVAAGEFLSLSDPRWVAGLARGAHATLLGLSLAVLSAIVLACFHAAYSWTLVRVIVVMLAIPPYGCGMWLLTTPDPSGLGEASYASARRIGRAALCIGLLGAGIAVASGWTGPGWLDPTLFTTSGLALIVGHVAVLLYLGKLCRRVQDAVLPQWARLVRVGMALLAILLTGMMVAVMLDVSRLAGEIMMGVFLAGLAIWIGGFGILILLCISFLMRLGMVLSREAQVARSRRAGAAWGGADDHGVDRPGGRGGRAQSGTDTHS
ncbi:MAG: hypothetical protein C4547_04960 [Phycisphaerales bacterium]|nr:MAG: hypothetical protein C4547_04960 [Phycisphaerales bacterium]